MADKTVGELPAVTTLGDADLIPVTQDGTNLKKVSVSQLALKIAAGLVLGGSGVTSVNGQTGAVAVTPAGIGAAQTNLQNVSNADFAAKAVSAGVGTGGGGGGVQLATTGTPANLGAQADRGSSGAAARADHVHQLPTPAAIGAIPASQKGAANGVAPLASDGKVDASYLPSGVVGFDEDATFSTRSGLASQSIKQRIQNQITDLTEYPGIDPTGVSDSTADWNAMVADVNAGLVKAIQLPAGTVLLAGNTNPFTKGIAILGHGDISKITTTNGTGTSTIIQFDALTTSDVLYLANFRMEATVQPKVRQAIQINWFQESLLFAIENVSIQGAFAKGIGVHNGVVARFIGVTMNGFSPATNDWAWNITADENIPRYSVEMRWVSCNVAGWEYGFRVRGHAEGLMWQQCVVGFCNYGWHVIGAGIAGVPNSNYQPEFHIHDCQAECQIIGIYFEDVAYLYISDYSVYLNLAGLFNDPGGSTGIHLKKVLLPIIHDNIIVGNGAKLWHGIILDDCNDGRIHDNTVRMLSGTGIWLKGTTNGTLARDNFFQSIFPAQPDYGLAAAVPWVDTTGNGGNSRRGQRVDHSSTDTDWKGEVSVNVAQGASLSPPSSIVAQADLPVCRGDLLRIQAQLYVETPVNATPGVQLVSLRIREYNHRPGTSQPWNTLKFGHDKNHIFQAQLISAAAGQKAAHFHVDAEMDVVATTPDAKFVLEAYTDIGSITVMGAQLRITRR